MTTPPHRLDPPAHYDEARRGIWADAVTRLTASGKVFRADPVLLDTYVEAVISHRQATRLVSQTSVLITRGDRAVENPALAVQRRTAETIARLTRTLGLAAAPMQDILAASPMRGDESRWCEEHQRLECKHQRKNRSDWCHGHVLIAGTGSCRMHVGMRIEDARRAGRVALARAYGSPLDVTPAEGLLDEVRWSAGHVAALRTLVLDLPVADAGADGTQAALSAPGAGGLWWGVTRQVAGPDGTVVTSEAGQHVILKAYNAEREHFLRACQAAVSAGAQQEAADAAREFGATVARLLEAVFEALGLDERQQGLVPVVVPQVLREFRPGQVP